MYIGGSILTFEALFEYQNFFYQTGRDGVSVGSVSWIYVALEVGKQSRREASKDADSIQDLNTTPSVYSTGDGFRDRCFIDKTKQTSGLLISASD